VRGPGARGVLPVGQTLKVAEYKLPPRAQPQADRPSDPDALFDGEHSGFLPFDATEPSPPGSGHLAGFQSRTASEEDPFGKWAFVCWTAISPRRS
jgi:hypothetical protein